MVTSSSGRRSWDGQVWSAAVNRPAIVSVIDHPGVKRPHELPLAGRTASTPRLAAALVTASGTHPHATLTPADVARETSASARRVPRATFWSAVSCSAVNVARHARWRGVVGLDCAPQHRAAVVMAIENMPNAIAIPSMFDVHGAARAYAGAVAGVAVSQAEILVDLRADVKNTPFMLPHTSSATPRGCTRGFRVTRVRSRAMPARAPRAPRLR